METGAPLACKRTAPVRGAKRQLTADRRRQPGVSGWIAEQTASWRTIRLASPCPQPSPVQNFCTSSRRPEDGSHAPPTRHRPSLPLALPAPVGRTPVGWRVDIQRPRVACDVPRYPRSRHMRAPGHLPGRERYLLLFSGGRGRRRAGIPRRGGVVPGRTRPRGPCAPWPADL